MPRRSEPAIQKFATVSLTHHALHRERAELLRRRLGRRSAKPECVVIGHAWSADTEREAGLICVVCDAVRRP